MAQSNPAPAGWTPLAWPARLLRTAWQRGMVIYLINLVWFAFPIFAAVLATPRVAAATCGLCALLAVLFVVSPGLVDEPLGLRMATVVVFVTILLVLQVLLPGSLHSCAIYLTVLIASLFGWPGVVPALGATILALLLSIQISPLPYSWVLVTLAAIIGLAVALGRRESELSKALQIANARNAVLAVAAERERIARDLHDILGHSLTSINVKTQLAGRLIDQEPAAARRELAEIEQISRQALTEVRTTSNRLREVRVGGEIASARSVLGAAGITPHTPSSVPALDDGVNELFGYAIREGITNVVRHAQASNCTIELDEHHVAVIDDGRGMPGRVADANSSGLRGLRERAAEHGAQVSLRSDRAGTRLVVSLSGTGEDR